MSIDPATAAMIASTLISAAGSIGGGILGSQNPKETKLQRKQRKTIDEILASIKGDGPFQDLFNLDEEAFQRSIVDPALRTFELQTAPQIQQKYIQAGLQRGTGLGDALNRAGVDLQSNIDKLYLDFQNQRQNRIMQALNQVLGAGAGVQSPLSTGEKFGQATAGYLSSPGFREDISGILGLFTDQPQSGGTSGARPGFEQTP